MPIKGKKRESDTALTYEKLKLKLEKPDLLKRMSDNYNLKGLYNTNNGISPLKNKNSLQRDLLNTLKNDNKIS